LSATHGSIVCRDNNPPWTIPSDRLHELQSILTQWKSVSPSSSNKPTYLAYPLDTPADGKKCPAPGPEDLVWCDRPLISDIERVCDGMGFSIFLARYERRVEPQGEEDDEYLWYHKEYKLGPPCDTAGKLLCSTYTTATPEDVIRPNTFNRWNDENESACIFVLLLVPDMCAFLDRLLRESKNVEPLIEYYQGLKQKHPQMTEASQLLEHICSAVIERHDHRGKHYGQIYYNDTKATTLVPVISLCMTLGHEQLLQRALQYLPDASVEAHAKLLFLSPEMPFAKIVEEYVLSSAG
jgi:hypothetical protein